MKWYKVNDELFINIQNVTYFSIVNGKIFANFIDGDCEEIYQEKKEGEAKILLNNLFKGFC